MEDAFKFEESQNGLCTEEEYPYLASDNSECSTDCTKVPHSQVKDYIDITEGDKHGLIASIVMHQLVLPWMRDLSHSSFTALEYLLMIVVEQMERLTTEFWQLDMVLMKILVISISRLRIAGEMAGVKVDTFVSREIPRMSLELVLSLHT